jgi:hypothetical protein
MSLGLLTGIVPQIGRRECKSAVPRRRERCRMAAEFRSTHTGCGHLGPSCPRRMRLLVWRSRTLWFRPTVFCGSGSQRCFTPGRNGAGRPKAEESAPLHCGQRGRPITPSHSAARRVENCGDTGGGLEAVAEARGVFGGIKQAKPLIVNRLVPVVNAMRGARLRVPRLLAGFRKKAGSRSERRGRGGPVGGCAFFSRPVPAAI